jgi:DNA repair exonuclease SbcCD nuclease subunit
MIRFVHTSDWQIGMKRHFLGAEAQARFDEARLEAIRKIGKIAADEGCEFVVVAGDVFDSNFLERRTVYRALEAIAEAKVPFYLLPGNHDALDYSSIYRSPNFAERKPSNLVVLAEPGIHPVEPPAHSTPRAVEILAAPLRTRRPLSDPLADAVERARQQGQLQDKKGLRIAVAHGQVDAIAPGGADPALISLEAAQRNIGEGLIDYIALGDRHSTLSVGETGRIWYSGSPEPTDYDEQDPGNILIVELNGSECRVDKRKIGTWEFIRREVELSGTQDLEALDLWLGQLSQKDRKILKLAFKGTLTISEEARLDEILDKARDLFAALEDWERKSDLAILPGDDLSDLGLSGFAKETLEQLLEEAKGSEATAEAGALVARDALRLLWRLAGGRP